MTLSLSRTSRMGVFALALAYTGATFGVLTAPAPAYAAASGPHYVAELAAPAKEARTVAAGVAWFCEGTTCKAGKGTSRDVRICRGLAKELGEVTSFTARNEALPAAELAQCNGK